ncbi:MAG: tryptophan synthase subunit alpha [Tenericutes bacterium HGW-Tenericutes-1]|jgi:tryptophan synthase alpha chain|nr:MAG: tryptophan synthase subunit alpha [Tenericutes bacterium HGW-Tenericutes-1]PKM57004.1 MAG: tryptophan synthase subunit alpha [Firmicutes bacterium HGW-Firmicutes-3]
MNLILYMSLGSPSLEKSIETARNYVAGGCDVIEADFPAKDPYLDSPYIQSRMAEALRNCPDYDQYMAAIETIKLQNPKTQFFYLIYERTILEIGLQKFIDFCHRSNQKDVILVGTEFPHVRKALVDSGLLASAFIRYHLPDEDIEVAKKANGFIYLQASPAGLLHPKYQTLKDIIHHLRVDHGLQNRINCGIGVSSPEYVKLVKEAGADGAFVGAIVLHLHEKPEEMKQLIRKLKDQTL